MQSQLYNACKYGDIQKVRVLLDESAEKLAINWPEREGTTPLHAACFGGNKASSIVLVL